jgi:hypothetical protein
MLLRGDKKISIYMNVLCCIAKKERLVADCNAERFLSSFQEKIIACRS